MAIKSTSQITITDVTDAYSVILSSEAFTIAGGMNGATSGSCKTSVIAMQGANSITPSVTASDITFQTASGVASDVLTASVDNTTNPVVPEITFNIASNKTLSETIEAIIPVKLANNTITINKKFSFGVAKTGATGAAGATWSSGTAITGTASTGNTGYAGNVGDQYLNTSTWNVYVCATAGTSSTAQWTKTGNIKGGSGAAGSKWFQGAGAPSATTVTSQAAVNDQYLNTSNGDVYKCTAKGTPGTWSLSGNIKGATGDTGPKGDKGDTGDDAIIISITTDNGDCFKNSSGNTTLTPEVFVGGASITIGSASTAGKFPVTINGQQCYLYWYRGDTKLTSSNTGSAAGKYGEFVTGTPNGRLKVYAIQVSTKQPYTCKIEDA